MRPQHLKQAELFAFLAAMFLVGIFILERERQRNPPIVVLSEERAEFRFALGSAEIPEAFQVALRERIIPQLDTLSRACNCNLIEVVGHTDGVPVGGGRSTLDQDVLRMLSGGADTPRAGSNIDLGMMRAVTIVRLFREAQAGGHLKRVRFFYPYSAGQVILPGGMLAAEGGEVPREDGARRRIEIRLRRLDIRPEPGPRRL